MYWEERIPWYSDGKVSPSRISSGGYSRREIAADVVVHVLGLVLGSLGIGVMLESSLAHRSTVEVAISLCVYGVSLLAMLLCSAIFHTLAWSDHIWLLRLADHGGILLFIAGTYSPFMTLACCPNTLCFVWGVAILSIAAKAFRSRFDRPAFHVPCFLLMGWCVVLVWQNIVVVFTPWARGRMVLGGLLYTLGLVPWKTDRLEFHQSIWHVCVLLASGSFLTILYHEVSQPGNWQPVPKGTCQGDLFST
jgi:hemolysin III